MKKKKLKINTALGILNIVAAPFYFTSFWFVLGAAFAEEFDGVAGAASGTMGFFYAIAVAGLALSIVAMIQSKKAHVQRTGHVLSIIGHAYFLVIPLFRGVVGLVMMILAAVFVLRHRMIAEANVEK